MSYLITNYKGKYRLRVPLDQRTNQFPRKLNGTYEDADVYIDCANGAKIFYYGHGILEAYIPSLIRGHNIIRAINEVDPKILIYSEESAMEVIFRFRKIADEIVIPLLKPKTAGARISPFSSKNLPKTAYTIPEEDLERYKDATKDVPKEQMLKISQVTKKYINEKIVTRKNKLENVKDDMILKGLRGKEYIHSLGRWDDFIKFLEDNL